MFSFNSSPKVLKLAVDISNFFTDIGIPVFDCYGLSETSPAVSMNCFTAFKTGSVGKPVDDVKVVIDKSVVEDGSDDGEIIVYGPNVMHGYHNKPEKTAEAQWYSADGKRIVFCSNRTGAKNMELFIVDADGKNERRVTFDQDHDWNPTVMNDGRVIYGRWEYVDRPAIPIQSLWTINPDGTMWLSGGIGFTPGVNDRAPFVVFDLGQAVDLTGVRVWNYAEAHVRDLTSRGTQKLRLSAGRSRATAPSTAGARRPWARKPTPTPVPIQRPPAVGRRSASAKP